VFVVCILMVQKDYKFDELCRKHDLTKIVRLKELAI
jgi:hypothetical protein